MGERGGLGGGDAGFVIESAGCTATGDVGTVCAGTEPGRELGKEPAAGDFVDRKTRKSLFATSLRRDMDSSSSARRSSESLLRSVERRLLTLGGMTEEGALEGTSAGLIWGNVISGALAGAGEPTRGGEPREEAGGDALAVVSKGSFSDSASRAKRLAAAKRMEVAACISAGGGGRAAHMFKNVRRRTVSSKSAKDG